MENTTKKSALYHPDYCTKLRDYFYGECFEKGTESAESEQNKEKLKTTGFPTLEKFTADNNLPITAIRMWEKEHPEFAAACSYARNLQKHMLIVNSLLGKYNTSFAKFFADYLGMNEKSNPDKESVFPEQLSITFTNPAPGAEREV